MHQVGTFAYLCIWLLAEAYKTRLVFRALYGLDQGRVDKSSLSNFCKRVKDLNFNQTNLQISERQLDRKARKVQ